MSTTLGKKTLHVLIFELEGQRHGLPVEAVREIVPMVSVVPLPQGPPTIEGVINIRGKVVAVLNARRCFGLPSPPARPTDHLIVARAEDRLIALHVDRALDLIQVDRVEEDQSDGWHAFVAAGRGAGCHAFAAPIARSAPGWTASGRESMPPISAPGHHGGWVAKLGNDLVLVHDLRSFLAGADGSEIENPLVGPSPDNQPGGSATEPTPR